MPFLLPNQQCQSTEGPYTTTPMNTKETNQMPGLGRNPFVKTGFGFNHETDFGLLLQMDGRFACWFWSIFNMLIYGVNYAVALTTNAMLTAYDTIRDAILTCARKPTWVSLIYRTEPTTKKCKNKKNKSRKQICSEITVNSLGNSRSEYLSRRKEGLQWEGFALKAGFKPGKKEWVGDGIPNNSKNDCWQIKTV